MSYQIHNEIAFFIIRTRLKQCREEKKILFTKHNFRVVFSTHSYESVVRWRVDQRFHTSNVTE